MDAREPRGFRIPLIRNARPVAKPLVQAGVVETLLYPMGAFSRVDRARRLSARLPSERPVGMPS